MGYSHKRRHAGKIQRMDEPLSAALAASVRMARAERRLTQEQFADALGLGRASLADIESGRRKIAVDDLEPLCRALGVTFADLLALTERGRAAATVLGCARP